MWEFDKRSFSMYLDNKIFDIRSFKISNISDNVKV